MPHSKLQSLIDAGCTAVDATDVEPRDVLAVLYWMRRAARAAEQAADAARAGLTAESVHMANLARRHMATAQRVADGVDADARRRGAAA
jgi:hypothetical protein